MAKTKLDNTTVTDQSEQEQTTDTKEVIKGQEVIDKIKFVAFTIDFMKDPEDAIMFRTFRGKGEHEGKDITGLVYEKWSEKHFERIIDDVSRLTGADPEQLRDPEKRTEEQQQALLKASAAADIIKRLKFWRVQRANTKTHTTMTRHILTPKSRLSCISLQLMEI